MVVRTSTVAKITRTTVYAPRSRTNRSREHLSQGYTSGWSWCTKEILQNPSVSPEVRTDSRRLFCSASASAQAGQPTDAYLSTAVPMRRISPFAPKAKATGHRGPSCCGTTAPRFNRMPPPNSGERRPSMPMMFRTTRYPATALTREKNSSSASCAVIARTTGSSTAP